MVLDIQYIPMFKQLKLYINRYMSYCQKHTNHHCVHSHNCKDPSHNKKKQRTNSASHQNKHSSSTITQKYRPPMGTIVDNEQCHFVSSGSAQGSILHIEAYGKQISSLSQQLEMSKRNFLNSDIENRKLKQRNSHLECQIQYLRQQLDVLVNNHNTDIHKEIKKSLIQHTQLNIKIKQLTTALFDKEKSVEELSSERYSLSRKNRQMEASIKAHEDKIKLITLKNQELSFDFTSSKNKIKELQTELKLLKDRYSTLATSAGNQVKQKENKLSEFQNQKQKLQRTHKTKESQLKRIKQLHEIEKKAWEKMIAQLKENMQKKDDQNKKYRQTAKQSEESLAQIKEDFQHAKKLILKYENVNEECEKVRYEAKRIQSKNEAELQDEQKKTVSKIQYRQGSQDQQTLSRLKQLQHQNIQLHQKIKDLEYRLTISQQPLQNKTNTYGSAYDHQSHNVIINQELILSIGASEQFKKIVQQKNITIKKLMREKADLYNRIYEQQAYKQ